MQSRFKFSFVIFFFILLLGFCLRIDNFSVWPRHGATFDEFAWTWLGVNLIQNGVPVSWSRHPQYKDRQNIIYQGAAFTIVKPYLEHPPLFGLFAGSFALLNGVSDMYDVTLEKIRPFTIGLGIFSILAIFLLVNQIYGERIALISSLLYSTIPTTVIGSRIVQNENFLIPFWIFSLYLLYKYIKTNKKILRNSSILIAALLPLAKVPWIVAPISLVMIFIYYKKFRDLAITIRITVVVFSIFFIYGYFYDKDLFFSLWSLQLNRYDLSFSSFLSIFRDPLIVDRAYVDGWIYFGFISILLLAQDAKKHIFVLLPFLSYFIIYLSGIPAEPGHGWYRYPFYPFLIISISLFLKKYLIKNGILSFLFFAFVGLPLIQNTWVPSFGFSHLFFRIVISLFLITLIPMFFYSKLLLRWSKNFYYLLFIALILFNIWSVMIYNEQ